MIEQNRTDITKKTAFLMLFYGVHGQMTDGLKTNLPKHGIIGGNKTTSRFLIRGLEEIENLVGLHGCTISDLPRPKDFKSPYINTDLTKSVNAVLRWYGARGDWYFSDADMLKMSHSFICHQMDAIERLCDALKEANENVEYLRESVEFMMDSAEPFEDQVDTGVYNACSEVLEMIDQLFWIKEKKDDKQ